MFYVGNIGGRRLAVLSHFNRTDYDLLESSFSVVSELDSGVLTADLASIALWSGEVSPAGIAIGEMLYGNVLWNSAVSGNTVGEPLVSLAVWLSEVSGDYSAEALSSAVVWSSTLGAGQFNVPALASAVDWVSVVSGLFGAEPLASSVVWATTVAGELHLTDTLVSTVVWSSKVISGSIRTFVVNTSTGAVSEYTGLPDTVGVGAFAGTLYIGGPSGLYALDANSPVEWLLKTGLSVFGSDKVKRVRDVNILGRTEGKAIVAARTMRDGSQIEDWFPMVQIDRDRPRDGVVKVGLGLASVYWGINILGIGSTEINGIKILVEPLTRRR